MAKEINIGMLGYAFMGKAHSNAYNHLTTFFEPDCVPVMKVICGRNAESVEKARAAYGWQETETDWEKVVQRDDIDVIDIVTPGNLHATMAIAAAEAGKHVFCEKPLTNTLEEAKAVVAAVDKAGVKHMICHNYRRAPAVSLAKELISDGVLGQLYHFRGTYLQDWIVDPSFPLVWRLQKEIAGSGALGDLGAHVIDLAHFLVDNIVEVTAATKTFIKERPLLAATGGGLAASGGEQTGEVTVDDAVLSLVRFENGAIGTIEATRFAPGRLNYNRFEINGSKGSIVFNLERLNELELFLRDDPDNTKGFRTIMCTDGSQPYAGAYWPGGHIIGYEHTFINTVYELMQALAKDVMPSPSFHDGLKNQVVLDAMERSAASGEWVKCV